MHIGAQVLPLGFSNVTACMQTWNRRLALNKSFEGSSIVRGLPGLEPLQELRLGKPTPGHRGDVPRAMWHMYLDDFADSVTVSRRHARWFSSTPSQSQQRLRELYTARSALVARRNRLSFSHRLSD